MGNIALAVPSDQRYGDPLAAEGGVALSRGHKDVPQGAVDLRIAGDQPPARQTQNIACGKNGIAGCIGVDETRARIDEKHARSQPVERIDERRDLRRLELEHSANQHGTSDVRRNQTHLPTRAIIDDAVSLVAEDSEDGRADRRPVDDGTQEIDDSLGFGPLTI